jgi:hypothetical protein
VREEVVTNKCSTIIWDGWCSIDIPEDWIWSEEGGVISTFNESEGVGVLQMSFARKQRASKPTKDEAIQLARSFIESQNWSIDERAIKVEPFGSSLPSTLAITTSGAESTSWKVWHVLDITRVACITYNCAESDKEVEKDVGNNIVASFQWR